MNDHKQLILQTAEQLFLRNGIKGVTMDDISRRQGISKKTIYLHFKDKNEIVKTTVQRYLETEVKEISAIKEKSENAIHELIIESEYIRKHMKGINPVIISELQKYHHQAWEIYLDFCRDILLVMIEKTLKRGLKEGVFRPDINISILSILRLKECQMVLDNQAFDRNRFDFQEVESQIMVHFMSGILTDTGREIFKQYHT